MKNFIVLFTAALSLLASGAGLTARNIEELRRLKEENPLPLKASQEEIRDVREKFASYELKRVNDTLVVGTSLINRDNYTWQQCNENARHLRVLSYLAKNGGQEQSDSLNLFADWLMSQQLVSMEWGPNWYATYRSLPADYLSILSVCDAARSEKMIRTVGKLLNADAMLSLDWNRITGHVSSDYIYLLTPHLFYACLYTPSESLAVDRLARFSKFLGVSLTYADGGRDILKRDGTCFHHGTHYNGYMYAFNTWLDLAYRMKGTGFRIDEFAYTRIRQAVMSMYLMAAASNGDKCYYATCMAGRHPFETYVHVKEEMFSKLIELGLDLHEGVHDTELEAFFNYMFNSRKYAVAPRDFSGFYQFNYSPAAVYRQGGWVAVMRSPTERFWGAEIYNRTNRLGRYQSHGALEILYTGDSLAVSGYTDGFRTHGAGWDWNMLPGTTTVHYTDWKTLMPNGNDKDRFDQKSVGGNFSGALSCGDYGLWAADFVQGDRWGGQRYTPTNLKFRKSVFAIDGMLFSLGSGISATGDYPDDMLTATNLFQQITDGDEILMVNGKKMKSGDEPLYIDGKKDVCFVTPCTSGYYIAAGHDGIVVKYGEQSSPGEKGDLTKTGTVEAAKAYINHGIKPSAASYEYLAVPAVGAKRMKKIASEQKNGKLFVTEACTEDLHVVYYKPAAVRAYALFGPAAELDSGCLMSSDTALLVTEKVEAGSLQLSVCCPDLKPVETGRGWKSSPTDAVIVLKGKWQLNAGNEACRLAYDGDNTEVRLHLEDGFPVHLALLGK